MALCGGLRIGVESSEPKTPPLEIVNVPPLRSSMPSLLSRARLGEARDLVLDLGERQLIGVVHDRHHEAALGADRDAEVDVLVVDDVGAVDLGVDERHLAAAPRCRRGRRTT